MRNLTIIWAAIIGVSVWNVLPVEAGHLNCGDTIENNESATLDADIGPCNTGDGADALRVLSRATLDLNGFTVECATSLTPNGIVMVGERSKLMNGEVRYCLNGVFVSGTNPGRNTVQNVTSVENTSFGFAVGSSRNSLSRNSAIENGADGFHLFTHRADRNKITDNSAH